MKKTLIIIFLFISFPVLAQDSGMLDVSPNIIDEKVKARDIKEYTVILKNIGGKRLDIYPVVNDYSENEGRQEFLEPGSADRSVSLSSWISIKRGVIELEPGKETEVALDIKVNPSAVPGKRHALIAFPNGSNRPAAEKNMLNANTASLMINFEVEEEIIEKTQIKNFKTDKNIYFKVPVNFNLEIDNFGNKEIVPAGSIYIYNRRGQEIDSLVVNPGKFAILAGESRWLENEWNKEIGLGKYKARLEAEYGAEGKRDLQDTIYFWVLPLKFIIIFGISLVFLMVLIVAFLFKKTYHHSHDYSRVNNIIDSSDGVLDLKNKK
ncbi:hypothetical protein DRH27_03225 [Candidatus Falkowbacteria bacterium]|nr:MAG: hypothetical protein DRH27_03225 [Candidatus Falkowbacteria bacterium]